MGARFIAAALLAGVATAAVAQPLNCPGNAVRLVVPWVAGGATDAVARQLAGALAQRWKMGVVVDNRAGAGGTIGTEQFVREKPDGCALLVATSSTNAAAPYLYARPGFEAKDFTPIAFVATLPNILVVGASSPYRSVDDLLKDARARPGALTYGTGGMGSSQQLAGAMLKNMAAIDIVHVPYKSSAPAVADMIGGHVTMVLDTGSMQHIRGGLVRPLAVAAKTRLALLPEVPTFDEAGVPGLYASFWIGLMGPARMPAAMVERLNADVNAVLQEPAVRRQVVDMGAEIRPETPTAFGRFAEDELQRYAGIVKASGAKAEQ